MDENEVQDCYAKVGEQVGEGREMISRPGMIVTLAAPGKGGGFSSASKNVAVVGDKKKRRSSKNAKTEVIVDETSAVVGDKKKRRSSKNTKTEVIVDETPAEPVVLKKQKKPIQSRPAKKIQDHEDVVDHIVRHEGSNDNLDQMEFLVRWSGYGSNDDTWQDYKSMKDTEAYQSYKSNGNFKWKKKRTHQSSDDESEEWLETSSCNKTRTKSTDQTKKVRRPVHRVTPYATQQRKLREASAGINVALDNILAKKANGLVHRVTTFAKQQRKLKEAAGINAARVNVLAKTS